MSRDFFAREALAQIPKILTLQDRHEHSPTYGCFDRNYWHYRAIDFPSGMAQEMVWPLALAAVTELEGNPWAGSAMVREWAAAGILYAARSAHPDGSCDDLFPHEKAKGAAAFSLLAGLETYRLLELHDEEMLTFFLKRADWLAGQHADGRQAHQLAMLAVCLDHAGMLLRTDDWRKTRDQHLARVLEGQDSEGWFPEKNRCDPGFHTLTFSLLAQLHHHSPSSAVEEALRRAAGFALRFVHPDGSFGGEYTGGNTHSFYPHGFEIAGRWMPEALAVNDRFLPGLQAGRAACHADDRLLGHQVSSYLLAWRHWTHHRPAPQVRPQGRTHFPDARLVIERRGDTELYLALNKGGAFKFFRGDRLAATDTQISVKTLGHRPGTAVAHLHGQYEVSLEEDEIVIGGRLGWARRQPMTGFQLFVLRAFMLTLGRFNPSGTRRLVEKIIPPEKEPPPLVFERRLSWREEGLEVVDTLRAADWSKVQEVMLGSSQTSDDAITGRSYQAGQLFPPIELTRKARSLSEGAPLIWKRIL